MSATRRSPITRSSHYTEIVTDGGLVVAPDQAIADAGAAVLMAGGNAVDAVVAAAFASGVVEPSMTGIGGSVTMTVVFRDPARSFVVDGHLAAPLKASPEHYPLSGLAPPPGWPVPFTDYPLVVGNANVTGAKAVATPGAVAALLAAHDHFGTVPRRTAMEPAIRLAADGVDVNWFLALLIASDLESIANDPGCREVFMPGGTPLRGPAGRPPDRLVQPNLAATLEAIAAKGPDVLYRGEVGASLVRAVQEAGGLLSMADLDAYRPVIIESPAPARYAGHEVIGPPISGFPTVLQALYLRDAWRQRGDRGEAGLGTPDDALAWARALRLAFIDRRKYMTTAPDVVVPWEALRSPAYARARLDADLTGAPDPRPHEFASVAPTEMTSLGGLGNAGHTCQVAVVDRAGNLASLTGTLLGNFGARLLEPSTGVLLNNGVAYFDPQPGSINGIRPGVRVFSAMSPVVLVADGRGPVAALGASGGRRIISGVAQMIDALTSGGASMQEAVEAPRIHAESTSVLLDVRWGSEAADALDAAGFTAHPGVEEPTTMHFARPNGVMIGPDGKRRSGVDPNKPGGAAAA